jgi:hypothetical protein
VLLVHGLNGVAQVVKYAHEGLEAPALAALSFPPLAVILKRPERDEGVV